MIEAPVLVLNHNYEPLNVCNVRRAFVLVHRGRAEILENGRGEIHSASAAFIIPSVIRLVYFIRRPRPQLRLSRREVLLRDSYTCQYCGTKARDLTLDHVIPRRKGGKHIWENVVAACKHCNSRKAGRTPQEAQMHLRRQPFRPIASVSHLFRPYIESQTEWQKFLAGWDSDHGFA